MAAPPRESPEDVKFCPVCKDHQLLPEDESIHGPMNLVYHQVCPICADKHPKAYAEIKKRMELATEGAGTE